MKTLSGCGTATRSRPWPCRAEGEQVADLAAVNVDHAEGLARADHGCPALATRHPHSLDHAASLAARVRRIMSYAARSGPTRRCCLPGRLAALRPGAREPAAGACSSW